MIHNIKRIYKRIKFAIKYVFNSDYYLAQIDHDTKTITFDTQINTDIKVNLKYTKS